MNYLFPRNKSLRRFLSRLYPPKCAACGRFLPKESTEALCPECRGKWEKEKKKTCRKCKAAFALCQCDLKRETNRANRSVYLTGYDVESPVTMKLLLKQKDIYRWRTTVFLAREMTEMIRSRLPYADSLLTYCPRSVQNRKRTAFDQSEKLARVVSENLAIPFLTLLERTGQGGQQKNLSPKERRSNVFVAYRLAEGAKEQIKGKNVILLDDISTTGATLDRCTSLLKRGGAAEVFCAYLAKSNHRSKPYSEKIG